MTATVVVDASVAVKWVLEEIYTAEAVDLHTVWEANGVQPIAPSWFACEVSNILFKRVRRDELALADAKQALAGILDAVQLRDPEPAIAAHALDIAAQLSQTATYDAQYAALAEAEGCELWTADERFWRAAQPLCPYIRWVGEHQVPAAASST